jgi:uncharacterized repeat protein (TIGR03803 family)
MICMVFACCAAAAITSPAQTFTTLVSFTGTNGFEPWSSLTQASDGNFYGTTFYGGDLSKCDSSGCGTIFKMTPSGTLTTIYSFSGSDGLNPGPLVQGSDGNFYGMTPCSIGSFHGTAFSRGAVLTCDGPGSVFKVSPSGMLVTLHIFNGADGWAPLGGLVQASDGNFYGTTAAGGAYNQGTVFKITPTGVLTTLHSFSGPDGGGPEGGLVQASDGNFYGTTYLGGDLSKCNSGGCGTIFKITPSGTLTTLHSFTGPDGARLLSKLVQATDGNFYGTTSNGGANNNCPNGGCGTVFKITPSGTLTTLYNFSGMDGAEPDAGLVQATDGNFYGTTYFGGLVDTGTAFRITPTGTLTILHSFCSGYGCPDGEGPAGGLVQGTNGLLYGMASLGGDPTCNAPAGCGTVFSLSGVNPIPNQFVPLTQPCRAIDTRPEHGGGGPIQGGTFRNFPISSEGACGTLPSAAAFSLNVSVVPNGPLSYLTVWPAGQPQPLVSTLNSLDGRIKANAAIIPAGIAFGYISIYATNTTNVIVDVNGYFAPVSGSTLAFYPLPPCRVADTRYSSYPQGLGPPFLTGGQERAFPILNATTTCNIPASGVAAYSLNFSVVPHGSLFYMTVWPTGETRPVVSTLNDIPGQIIANAAIVTAGASGDVSVYPTNDTDLIIDINGYFAAAGQGGLSLYGVSPCRVIDTRKVGGGQPFSGTLSPPVNVVGSPCGVPSLAQAYVFNATVVPAGALGYLTLWPDGTIQPLVSTLNALDGSISSNMAIVPTNNGEVDAFASGLTQLILDISSYFAP